MMGKLKYEIDGIVVAEQEIPVNCDGVNSTLLYKAAPGVKAIPWPLDANGDPLPVELDPKSISICS